MFRSRYQIIKRAIQSDLKAAPIIPLNQRTKILAIGDTHKGRGKFPPDDFIANKWIKTSVLRTHQFKGYEYLDLGDDSDEWENPWQIIWANYEHEFRLERSMYPITTEDEKVKVLGNHDRFVEFNQEALKTMYGGVRLAKAVWIGEAKQIFAAHGYRGDFWCDHNWKITRQITEKLWVPWQKITHLSGEPEQSPFPSKNEKRRTRWEQHLVNVCCELGLIGLFGHTHRSYSTDHYWNGGSCLKTKAIQGMRITGYKLQRLQWQQAGYAQAIHETVLDERILPHSGGSKKKRKKR